MEKYLLIASSSDSVEMTQIVECLEHREIPVLVEHVNIRSESRDLQEKETYRVLVAQDFFQLALAILNSFREKQNVKTKTYAFIENEFQIIH